MLSETGNHTLNDLIYTPRLVPPFRRATKDGAFFVALSVYCLNSIRFRRKKTCKKRVRKSRNPLFPTGFCYNGGEGENFGEDLSLFFLLSIKSIKRWYYKHFDVLSSFFARSDFLKYQRKRVKNV